MVGNDSVTCACVILEDSIVVHFAVDIDKHFEYFHSWVTDHSALSLCVVNTISTYAKRISINYIHFSIYLFPFLLREKKEYLSIGNSNMLNVVPWLSTD